MNLWMNLWTFKSFLSHAKNRLGSRGGDSISIEWGFKQ